jgi:adenosylcobinamide-GDP ribazoletransferase
VTDGGRRPAGFLGAAQFLTRVPIRLRSAPDLARCVPWFPVVGALIGAAVGAVAAGAIDGVAPGVGGALAVIAGLLITGAFHEDGLADTMDALGGTTPARRREILEDSRHGSYGVAAMCSTIVLRAACIAALGPAAAFAGCVAAHTLGRGAAVAVMATTPPAAGQGLGADHSRALSTRGAIAGVVAALAISALATGWWVAPLAGAATVAAIAVARLARRAFEGVSGDILGAVEQVAECSVLVVTVARAAHSSIWWA